MRKHRPAFRILVNGNDLAGALVSRVKSVCVTDAAGFESDTVELCLADDDAEPIALPPTGAELRVWLGYGQKLEDMGMFIVDEIEPGGWPAYLTVRGRAAPFETSKAGRLDLQTQKTRAWDKGTKLADMVAKIAMEHGMRPAVGSSLQEITLPHLDQVSESDISFLVRVARRYDALVKPGGGSLLLVKRGEPQIASGGTLRPVTIQAQNCTRWHMNISARDSEGTVVAYYHDRGAARRQSVARAAAIPCGSCGTTTLMRTARGRQRKRS